MPSQDVLVVIDNEASVARRLAPVAALAKRVETRLTGMFVTGLPVTNAYADLQGWAQLLDTYLVAQRAEALKAERAFRAELARLNLTGERIAGESDVTEGVVAMARLRRSPSRSQAQSGSRRPRERGAAGRGRAVLRQADAAGALCRGGDRTGPAYPGGVERHARSGAGAARRDVSDRRRRDGDGARNRSARRRQRRSRASCGSRRRRADASRRRGQGRDRGFRRRADRRHIILSTAADLTADLIVMRRLGAFAAQGSLCSASASRGILQEMTVPVLMSH